jgi:hypothetical protein
MAPLPLKTLIREKNARVWSVCSRQEQENSRSYIVGAFMTCQTFELGKFYFTMICRILN